MPIAYREFLSQIIIKRYLILVVEVDRLIVGRTLHTIVSLLGQIVHPDESIVEALSERVVRIFVVVLLVCWIPGVIQVWHNAPAGVVKCENLGAVVV